ncbi:MAG TPA: hypothetical protein ENL07_10455 [Chlorobaculum parvum]|uniref:Uncharacterized protein n=1 Tax=Chlorobaculum parvum TaxID=274539 RepID=A0A7C5DLY9_9CHLB|nr:hypothetical protein [Chlorobaculum parvum]
MDTIIVAAFGIPQAIMVVIATKNYQESFRPDYTLNINDFDNQIFYLLIYFSISILLGVIAYAHSGAKASEGYVKKAIIEHYNSCPKCKGGKNHCTYQPDNLYDFLIGFEARCVFGTLTTSLLLFLNTYLYIILTKKYNVSIITSSIICIIILFLVIYHYVWRYDFKREISNKKRTQWLTTIGSCILTKKYNYKIIFWILIVPYLMISHFPLYSKKQERKAKERMNW